MSSSPLFQCPTCGYRTHAKGNLTVHLKRTKRCKPKEQWPFPCSWCEKGFDAPDSYRRHRQQCHPDQEEEPRDHVCTLCHGVYRDWFKFKLHLHRKHQTVLSAVSSSSQKGVNVAE